MSIDPRPDFDGDEERRARLELVEYCFTGAAPLRSTYVPAYMFVRAVSEALSRMAPADKRAFFDWLHDGAFREQVCLGDDDEQIFRRVVAVLDGIVEDRRAEKRDG